MSKKWKKVLKVVVLVVAIIFVVYHLLFYVVKLPKDYVKKLEADYGEYILLSHKRIQLKYFFPSLPEFRLFGNLAGGSSDYDDYCDYTLFFFRWDADAVKEELLTSFKKRMEEIENSSAVLNYTYDEETFDVDITLDKSNWEYLDVYFKISEELKLEYRYVRDFCKYNSIFNHKSGSFEYHDNSSDIEKPETKEYAYNEQEIDLLNEIISRSLDKTFFDLGNEDKIKGDSEDGAGGHICYLDLSDYNYITGKLDLSGFTELKYILLRGMKISEVILPESLERIDERSFAYCGRLKKIIVPKNVKSLENPIFSGCKSLKEIIFEGNAPEVSWEREDIFGKVPDDLVIYRKKSAKSWQETVWDKYDVRIMDE